MIQNIKVDKGEVTMSNKNLDESMETFLNGNESHRNNMETIEDFLNSEIGADVDEEEIEEGYELNEIPSPDEVNSRESSPVNPMSEKLNAVKNNFRKEEVQKVNNQQQQRPQNQANQQQRPQHNNVVNHNQNRAQQQAGGRHMQQQQMQPAQLDSNRLGVKPVSTIFKVTTHSIKKFMGDFINTKGFNGIAVASSRNRSKKGTVEFFAAIPSNYSQRSASNELQELMGDKNFTKFRLDNRLRGVLAPFCEEDSKVNIPKSKDYTFVHLSTAKILSFVFQADKKHNLALLGVDKLGKHDAVLTVGKEVRETNTAIDVEELLNQLHK